MERILSTEGYSYIRCWQLFLDGNKITDEGLTYESFLGFVILEKLLLWSNLLTKFPNLTALADTLKMLAIGNNKLSFISPGSLEGFNRLGELDLSSNQLTSMPDFSLLQLPIPNSLGMLKMAYNQIITIPSNMSISLYNLREFYFRGNALSDLCVLDNFSWLIYLDVIDNPLDCTPPKLCNLRNKLITFKVNKCAKPEAWSTRAWDDITTEELCPVPGNLPQWLQEFGSSDSIWIPQIFIK